MEIVLDAKSKDGLRADADDESVSKTNKKRQTHFHTIEQPIEIINELLNRGQQHSPQKYALSAVLAKAKNAVFLDATQDVEGAREAYFDVGASLQQVMDHTLNPNDHEKLSKIRTTYVNRLKELHELNVPTRQEAWSSFITSGQQSIATEDTHSEPKNQNLQLYTAREYHRKARDHVGRRLSSTNSNDIHNQINDWQKAFAIFHKCNECFSQEKTCVVLPHSLDGTCENCSRLGSICVFPSGFRMEAQEDSSLQLAIRPKTNSNHRQSQHSPSADNLDYQMTVRHQVGNYYCTDSQYQSLLDAIFEKDKNLVLAYLANGLDINADIKGFTPLYTAVSHNDEATTKFLIEHGANVNISFGKEDSALHMAARHGNLKLVTLLLDNGAQIDGLIKSNYTALHVAVAGRKLSIMRLLIEKGINVNAESSRCGTALHEATATCQLEAVKLLLEKQARVDIQCDQYGTALHEAVARSSERIVKLLIQSGANTNATTNRQSTPLHIATKQGHVHVVRLLLENHAEPNLQSLGGGTVLQLATKCGKIEIVEILLANKAKVNDFSDKHDPPLHIAARDGKEELVRLLLCHGADPDIKTKHHGTALQIAAQYKRKDVIRILHQHKIMQQIAIPPKLDTGLQRLFQTHITKPMSSHLLRSSATQEGNGESPEDAPRARILDVRKVWSKRPQPLDATALSSISAVNSERHHEEDEWEAQRANFTRYYKDQSMTLEAATKYMITNHNFYATPRQWERKIATWNLYKYSSRQTRLEQIAARGKAVDEVANASRRPRAYDDKLLRPGESDRDQRNIRRFARRESSRSRSRSRSRSSSIDRQERPIVQDTMSKLIEQKGDKDRSNQDLGDNLERPTTSETVMTEESGVITSSSSPCHSDNHDSQEVSSQTSEEHVSGAESEMSFVYGSNIDECSPEVAVQCSKMVAELLDLYFASQTGLMIRGTTNATVPTSTSSGQNIAQQQSSTYSTTNKSSNICTGKRAVTNEVDDEDGPKRRKRPNVDKTQNLEVDTRLLACPYAKFDSRRYSERNALEKQYRGCSSCYVRDIPRLKQHLYRVHRRPEHHCLSCFSEFENADAVTHHSRQRPSCEVKECPFMEKMNADQLRNVKRREMGKDRVRAWFDIYTILFPAATLPADPFVDSEVPPGIDQFLDFLEWQAPAQISASIGERLLPVDCPQQSQIWSDMIIQECVSAYIQRLRGTFGSSSSS